jgi:hypothetical protein
VATVISGLPSCVVRDIAARAHTLTFEVGGEAAFAALVADDAA